MVVVGDGNGRAGVGLGKSASVPDAVRKGNTIATKSMVKVLLKDTTIPHEIVSKFGGAKVVLRPAGPGTGVIAGGGVRAVLEAAGVKDVLTKSLGSSNPINHLQGYVARIAAASRPGTGHSGPQGPTGGVGVRQILCHESK